MKLATPKQLIELLPPGDNLDQVLRAFEALTPTRFRTPGDCLRMIQAGDTIPVTISINRVPAYLITYHFTTDGGFWLDIAQTLSPAAKTAQPLAALVHGAEALAKQQGARYIRFTTARRGLVKLTRLHGYRPEAVMMVKEVA